MPETILITGVSGQDGAYLSRLALEKGYRVVGGARRHSTGNNWRLKELGIERDVEIVDFELLEDSNVRATVETVRPTRIFNLAAQSFVGASFQQPLFTANVDALGVLRLLEAIRSVDASIRFYQASSSEMFGLAAGSPQSEGTSFHPRSPYGAAKVFGHHVTVNYREAYGLHASSGILFNHESPLRGEEFVTRKVTSTLSRIAAGSDEVLEIGNLDARRDWGHAREYVEGIWSMTDQAEGGDFVLATGVSTTVRDFVRRAAECLGMHLVFSGSGLEEEARAESGRLVVRVNRNYYRPAEVGALVGDARKARRVLGWQPEIGVDELVREMVAADRERLGR